MTATEDRIVPETDEYLAFDELVCRFYELEPRRPVRTEFGAMTHAGNVRENNEDNYLVTCRRRERDVLLSSLPVELLPHPEQTAYVMAVADGMGGHAFGDLASYLALRTGWDLGEGEVKWAVKMNEHEAHDLERKAHVFFRLIHRTLHAAAAEQPRLQGMGTTLTICYTTGPELFVMHAGDSRAYLSTRDGALEQLTRDHTVAQALVDAGIVQPGSPEARRRRHALTNCLGGPSIGVEVDVIHRRLADGDRLLLCTDGLTDMVTDTEIAAALAAHPHPADTCRALVELALAHGGKDNVTVVVGRYGIGDEPAAPESGVGKILMSE
jgi:PPM family protein phosphatase